MWWRMRGINEIRVVSFFPCDRINISPNVLEDKEVIIKILAKIRYTEYY